MSTAIDKSNAQIDNKEKDSPYNFVPENSSILAEEEDNLDLVPLIA